MITTHDFLKTLAVNLIAFVCHVSNLPLFSNVSLIPGFWSPNLVPNTLVLVLMFGVLVPKTFSSGYVTGDIETPL